MVRSPRTSSGPGLDLQAFTNLLTKCGVGPVGARVRLKKADGKSIKLSIGKGAKKLAGVG